MIEAVLILVLLWWCRRLFGLALIVVAIAIALSCHG